MDQIPFAKKYWEKFSAFFFSIRNDQFNLQKLALEIFSPKQQRMLETNKTNLRNFLKIERINLDLSTKDEFDFS